MPDVTSGHVRRPEIDWAKGVAILCVLLIHSKPLEGHAIHTYVIDRAVPMFVVLFGMTSEHWWEGRAAVPLSTTLPLWYRTRLWRLLVPMWGTLLAWWTFVAMYRHTVRPQAILMSVFGYLPRVGTGWFVTLILQLVVVFPLLHLGLRKLGDVVVVLAAVAVLLVAQAEMRPIADYLRVVLRDSGPPDSPLFYFWIFAPAWLYGVAIGAVVIRRHVVITARGVVLCAALAAIVLMAASQAARDGTSQRVAVALTDPLLTMAVLGIVPIVAWWSPAAWFLAWCGSYSWGIYLGQLLVHNVFLKFGPPIADLSTPLRWAYFAYLLFGALGLVKVGEGLRSIIATKRRAGSSAE